jgi:hypothetical protein
MNPIIINNELSGAAVHTIHDNVDSLAIDGVNGTWFDIELDANGSITLANIPIGVFVYLNIKNTHATDNISITIPAHIGDPTPAVITAGDYLKVQIFYDGTNYHIVYGAIEEIFT